MASPPTTPTPTATPAPRSSRCASRCRASATAGGSITSSSGASAGCRARASSRSSRRRSRSPTGARPRPSSSVRAGRDHPARRPAPIEPDVPRHFESSTRTPTCWSIDKPAGLPMHTTAKFWRNTLTALLRERYPDEPMQIAHRIDRETSGVLLVARTPRARPASSSAPSRAAPSTRPTWRWSRASRPTRA